MLAPNKVLLILVLISINHPLACLKTRLAQNRQLRAYSLTIIRAAYAKGFNKCQTPR
jgi:hypothetical protein